MPSTRIAVLISGRGTNLQSLIDACAAESFPAEIALVISNRPGVEGLERARTANIAHKTIDHRSFGAGDEAREKFEDALNESLDEANVDFVCLAGFMRLFTRSFVSRWRGKLINIHPSLLPAFKGLNVHERMIDSGVKLAGCSVHFVSAEVDAGPIIGQAAVAVAPNDTAESLAARILSEEHKLYPACVRLLAEGKARLGANGRVRLDEDTTPAETLHNPAL